MRFLKHLLQHIAGNILVIWDGSPIHRSRLIKDFLTRAAAQRLRMEMLPGYAPHLNPLEYVWHYLKHEVLRNVCCYTLDELQYELRLAVANLRHKRTVSLSWPKHTFRYLCSYQYMEFLGWYTARTVACSGSGKPLIVALALRYWSAQPPARIPLTGPNVAVNSISLSISGAHRWQSILRCQSAR